MKIRMLFLTGLEAKVLHNMWMMQSLHEGNFVTKFVELGESVMFQAQCFDATSYAFQKSLEAAELPLPSILTTSLPSFR